MRSLIFSWKALKHWQMNPYKVALSILLALVALSCNPCRYASKHPECFKPDTVVMSHTTTVHDTIIYLEESESTLEAYFECDSTNRVLMSRLVQTEAGRPVKPTVIFRENTLRVRYYQDSIATLNRLVKETQARIEYRENPINMEMQDRISGLELWKKIGISGIILAVFVLVFAIIRIFV